ncbi:hypothetical protein [Jiella marina]|uniref:hypothetical protein n=1 Tax=Jiella sp. LLJ827 TaxID=2917712 RepID=UPI002101CF6F|nr:hypothetical protein [Jiella sp. LLJ827]MCQ0987163.1 hypothetical protein [Jiella sp. LLJ827]
MDLVSIASAAVIALTPFLTKVGESAGEEVGKKTLAVGEKLLELLYRRWQGKPEAEDRLANLATGEESAKADLQSALAVEMATDAKFAELVKAILENDDAPELNIDQDIVDGEELTGARIREVLRGRINVRQKAENVKTVTGIDEIDTFG